MAMHHDHGATGSGSNRPGTDHRSAHLLFLPPQNISLQDRSTHEKPLQADKSQNPQGKSLYPLCWGQGKKWG